jgi:predicted transcriptional regulator
MAERQYELGAAELEVLKVLWDEGPSTVRQVLQHLRDAGRNVAYTTVLTFLTRLEQKGFVSSDKSGLAHVFRAAVSRERISRSRLRNLVREMYDGAAGSLVLHLVKTERLSADELAELQKLIDELDAKTRRTKS